MNPAVASLYVDPAPDAVPALDPMRCYFLRAVRLQHVLHPAADPPGSRCFPWRLASSRDPEPNQPSKKLLNA